MARVKSDFVQLENAETLVTNRQDQMSGLTRKYGYSVKHGAEELEVAEITIEATIRVLSSDRDNFAVDLDNLIKFYNDKRENPKLQATAKAPRKPKKDQPA